MLIANKLKTTNRAEYLLYMWQVEDIIRAYACDEERIAREYISRFSVQPDERREIEQWYANLCEMMRTEGVREEGHLQICKNILQQLEELNAQLLASQRFPYYRAMYYKVLPYIVELRHKQHLAQKTENAASTEPTELKTCFEALYGVMLLRLQGRPVSDETTRALKDLTSFLGQLSDYYFKDQQEALEF